MLQHAATQCFRIAAYCQDTSRFDGGCPCSPLRRALPVCSRAEQTALGTQSGCAPRWRPRARLTARTGGQHRPSTAGCAWKSAICLKQGADAVTRFILITMVSRFWSIKGNYGSLPAHPTGAPPTGGLGPGPDMEAARRAPYCSVRPEEGPGAELERSLIRGHPESCK